MSAENCEIGIRYRHCGGYCWWTGGSLLWGQEYFEGVKEKIVRGAWVMEMYYEMMRGGITKRI